MLSDNALFLTLSSFGLGVTMKFKGFDEEQLANIFIRAVKNVIDLVNLPSEKVIRLNRV